MTNYHQLFKEDSPNIIEILAQDFQNHFLNVNAEPKEVLTNFINQSPHILIAAEIIQQTEKYLNQESTITAGCFARESLLLILKETYIDTELIEQFAQAAIDDTPIPQNWQHTVNWINKNLDKPTLSYYYQEDIIVGIHPLISRKLKNSPTNPEIENYCAWLEETIFKAENISEDIPTTTLLASAYLIIHQAKQQGVTIEAEGELTTLESAIRWGELTNTVLNKIVKESEIRNITKEIKLLSNWHRAPLIYNLRKRCQHRLQATIDKLITHLDELPHIPEDHQKAQAVASKIDTTKQELEKRFSSPFAPPNLPEIAINNLDIPMPIGIYLQKLIPEILDFNSQIIIENQTITENLDKLPLWQQIINQSYSNDSTSEEILQAWAKIDVWAELSHKNPSQLNTENLDTNNLDKLRPQLAAIVYLGTTENQQTLLENLESINNQSLIAAIRLEILLRNLDKENIPNIDNQLEIRQWIESACQSNNLWELRAGMNGAILLARLAETTGNIYYATALKETLQTAPKIKELVRYSIQQLLQPAKQNTQTSGLPLALAAFDLIRYHREYLLRIAPATTEELQPVWWQQNAIIPLINNLSHSLSNFPPPHLAVEGGYGRQLLLLSIFNIKLDQLKWERQFKVTPHHLEELNSLQISLKYIFSRQQLFLAPTTISTSNWQEISYWNNLAVVKNPKIPQEAIELYNWGIFAHNYLLSMAAMLDTTYNSIKASPSTDVDNRNPGEFPRLSYQEARNRLKQPVEQLQNLEREYTKTVNQEKQDNQNQEIINLLKHPLNLATVDHQEQINASIADVKKAEAELAIAEKESIAAGLEVEIQTMIHQAAEVEVERQATLSEVSRLDEDIAQLDRQIAKIEAQQTRGEINIQQKNIEIAKIKGEQSLLRIRQVTRSKNAIQKEIELIKRLLEVEIPRIATEVETNLITKIDQGIREAQEKRDRAIAEAEARRQRGFWRRLIGGVCRFFGAVVGAVFGGPLGAAIGAQIGSSVANLTCNIISGKSFGEIFTELISDVNQVAAIAGIDLEKELNKLGAKGAQVVNQFLDKIEASFESILVNIPQVIKPEVIDTIITNTVEIFDVPEINQLTETIKNSYQDLRRDVDSLGQIGTVLKSLGNNEVIDLSNPRQLLTAITENLNTTENIQTIEVVATVVNEKVENLKKDPEARYQAIEKFGKIIITKISQESYDFKQNTLTVWIRQQQENKRFWDNPVVKEEGKKLVQELFPDKKTTYKVLANLEDVLCNPEKLKGKIQHLIAPWQASLEAEIKHITSVEQNPTQPRNAEEAANQQITYLEETKSRFNNRLLPWLKGQNNPERNELLAKLNKLVDTTLPNIEDELEIANLEELIANINEENSVSTLEILKQKLEILEKNYHKTDIRKSQASLLTETVELAKLTAENLAKAKKISVEAARVKQEASRDNITKAKHNLESYQYQAEGIKKRAVEARNIRDILSQPPLKLPILVTETPHQIRVNYLREIEKAFTAYRELLRYYYASGNDHDFTKIEDIDPNQPWSTTLSNYYDQIAEIFTSTCRQTTRQLELNLTPSQIQSLLSPEGFKIIVFPNLESLLTLFTVPEEWKVYLDNLANADLNDSEKRKWLPGFEQLWLPKFADNGINLGDIENITVSKTGQGWQITAPDLEPTEISIQPDGSEYTTNWTVSAPVTYLIRKKGNQLVISYRNNIREEARSDFRDCHLFNLSDRQVQTGKIAAIFFEGKILGQDGYITSQEYYPEVIHLGQMFAKNTIKQVQPRKLNSNRVFLIDDKTNPRDRLNFESEFFRTQGDPNPYSVQGIPLSGTTIIRLFPTSYLEAFSSLKLHILYSYVE